MPTAGLLRRDLRLPDFRAHAVDVPMPGGVDAESTRVQGKYLRDVMKLNLDQRELPPVQPRREQLQSLERRPRRHGPLLGCRDLSRGTTTFRPTGASWRCSPSISARVGSKGYLLTGRHGFFSCYEAFIHIVDSMFNQHAKWLKVCNEIPWRRPISSLNYLLSSHVWRQDHNGFSHQDPGFIDHVVNKKAEVIRVYLPPDANTLLGDDHSASAASTPST